MTTMSNRATHTQKIVDDLKRIALCDAPERQRAMMARIVKTLARKTGISEDEILSETRRQPIARIRQYAYHLAAMEGLTQTAIGHFFRRDHTTIHHGIKAIRRRLEAQQ